MIEMGHVCVVGATGFVGRATCVALDRAGYRVHRVVRNAEVASARMSQGEMHVVRDVRENVDWCRIVAGMDAIIYLAARVHVMNDCGARGIEAYRSVNTDAALRVAQAAADSNVQQFIYMSSVKVYGERTTAEPWTEDTPRAPTEPYGWSKLEAEEALFTLAQATSLGVTVLRPPLVYGAEAVGNFARLLTLAVLSHRIPLPLGQIENRRSLVYVENLASAIVALLARPTAGARAYVVDDGTPMSTPTLIRTLGECMGIEAKLFGVRPHLLRILGRVVGYDAEVRRLTDSLWVDSSRFRSDLGWTPPYTLSSGLEATVKAYLTSRGKA